jgi:hypothetical protein
MWQDIVVGILVIGCFVFVISRFWRNVKGIRGGSTECMGCDKCGTETKR